jgi:hypothetical protein
MIIIAGDSWGCGAWTDLGPRPVNPNIPNDKPLLHGGLAQFISEAGHNVVNLSVAGGSNLQVARRIETWLERNPDVIVSNIIILQTEYTRDQRIKFPEDYDHIIHANSLRDIWISRFYQRLSHISTLSNSCVTLIGGMSDTFWFDDINREYPGIRLACQSLTTLLIENNPRVQYPIFSWYDGGYLSLIADIKNRIPVEEIPVLLKNLDHGYDRENLLYEHPEYFWPDGRHPNEAGHLKLYCYLKDNNYI